MGKFIKCLALFLSLILLSACGNDLRRVDDAEQLPDDAIVIESSDGQVFTTSGKSWKVNSFKAGYYCQRWNTRGSGKLRKYLRCSKGRSYNAADFGAFKAYARKKGFSNCYHNFLTRLQCHRR